MGHIDAQSFQNHSENAPPTNGDICTPTSDWITIHKILHSDLRYRLSQRNFWILMSNYLFGRFVPNNSIEPWILNIQECDEDGRKLFWSKVHIFHEGLLILFDITCLVTSKKMLWTSKKLMCTSSNIWTLAGLMEVRFWFFLEFK